MEAVEDPAGTPSQPGGAHGVGGPPEEFLALMSRHVMARIGMGASDDGDGDGTMSLYPAPVTLDADGHVDFGVLGVFFDMAASNAFDPPRGGVHADISITRLRAPSGPMTATAREARQGARTGVVGGDLHDDAGHLVATSTQEIVFRDVPGADPAERAAMMEEMRARFRALFDGTCRLDAPLAETLGIERRAASWHMAMAPDRTNGGGALHGGCAIALVATAAADAAADVAGRAGVLQASVRYLAPARVGPFTATAEVTGMVDGVVVLRIRVTDDGQEGRSVILADVQALRRAEPSATG